MTTTEPFILKTRRHCFASVKKVKFDIENIKCVISTGNSYYIVRVKGRNTELLNSWLYKQYEKWWREKCYDIDDLKNYILSVLKIREIIY